MDLRGGAGAIVSRYGDWVASVRRDMQPMPERLNSALRVTLAASLTLIFMVLWHIPFAAIGVYFVFLMGRDSFSTTMRSGMILFSATLMAVFVSLSIIIVFDNDPMARLVSVSVVGFLAGLFAVSTSLPLLPAIWGFLTCTLLSQWETHAPSKNLVETSLWLLAMAAIPIVLVLFIEYIFVNKSPVEELISQRRSRYEALDTLFSLYAQDGSKLSGDEGKEYRVQLLAARDRVLRLASTGQSSMQRLYNTIVDRGLNPGTLPIGARVRISMLAQLMDVSAAFAGQAPEGLEDEQARNRVEAIATVCRSIARNIIPNPALKPKFKPNTGAVEHLTRLDHVENALHYILTMPGQPDTSQDRVLTALPSDKVAFLTPGAFRRPENIAFAFKLCAAVTLCYVFFWAVDWPGISTSVTTVFIVGLSTTGAIKQKSLHRFTGSAIGGLIFGIGSEVFLFPYMDSITALVALVGSVTFIAAWIAFGRTYNYVGLQIAFAFYLVALEGFRAPTELAPARDRLVGILLATIVMWFIFDQMWPVRTVTAMRRSLAHVLQADAHLLELGKLPISRRERLQQADVLRDRISKTVMTLRTMNDYVPYEYGLDREAHMQTARTILSASYAAVTLFWNEMALFHAAEEQEQEAILFEDPTLVELRHRLAVQLERMSVVVLERQSYSVSVADAIALLEGDANLSPRDEEYARNAVAGFVELQENIAGLSTKA